MEQLLTAAMQLGLGGVFAVMWWIERREAARAYKERDELARTAIESHAQNGELMEIVRQNSQAIQRMVDHCQGVVARREVPAAA